MADYTAKVNFNVKVLDFVQYGGPAKAAVVAAGRVDTVNVALAVLVAAVSGDCPFAEVTSCTRCTRRGHRLGEQLRPPALRLGPPLARLEWTCGTGRAFQRRGVAGGASLRGPSGACLPRSAVLDPTVAGGLYGDGLIGGDS